MANSAQIRESFWLTKFYFGMTKVVNFGKFSIHWEGGDPGPIPVLVQLGVLGYFVHGNIIAILAQMLQKDLKMRNWSQNSH